MCQQKLKEITVEKENSVPIILIKNKNGNNVDASLLGMNMVPIRGVTQLLLITCTKRL